MESILFLFVVAIAGFVIYMVVKFLSNLENLDTIIASIAAAAALVVVAWKSYEAEVELEMLIIMPLLAGGLVYYAVQRKFKQK
ncbi:hypothetical protein SAMN05444392_107173 [Seinonella peptonophila]|uniref:Uncharacterized protein n=1 Tax=Seinonella peptonophila TaxID=112248 RepID=A0A1M4YVN6_9BACL|nr:hypothetical protein [Seinonella peptonophila]SHF09795.1 hypothetical protein SAMN05444392_107173 [Seinonella peptonophila]